MYYKEAFSAERKVPLGIPGHGGKSLISRPEEKKKRKDMGTGEKIVRGGPYQVEKRSLDVDVPNLYRSDPETIDRQLRQYANDYGCWYNESLQAIGEMGWDDRWTPSRELDKKAREFRDRGIELHKYMVANQDQFDPDHYTNVVSFLNDLPNYSTGLQDLFMTKKEVLHKFDSKKSYDAFLEDQALRQIPQTALNDPNFDTLSQYSPVKANPKMDGTSAFIYSVINGNGSYYNVMGTGVDAFPNYSFLTEEEKRIYNYYFALGDYATGKKYLDSLADTLTRRSAEEQFAEYEGRTGKEILYGIDTGLDQFASGLRRMGDMLFGGEDEYPVTEKEYLSGMIREDLADDGFHLPKRMGGASLGQVAFDAVSTTSQMLPSVLTAAAADLVIPGSGKILGNALVFSSSGGNAYTEARRMGFGEKQASGYALLVGASEAGLGYLLGGVSELGGKAVDKVLGKILPSVDNALAKIAISYGGKIIMEGNEEALQEVLEPVFKKIALNIDADIDWEEAAYSWFLGALNSAGYGGADVIVDLGKAYGLWDTETANKTLPSYDPALLEGPETAGPDTGRATLPDHDPVALGEPGRTGADTVRPALPEDTAVPFDQPLLQPDTQTPQNTPDTWTADMDGLWTDTEADPDPLTDSGTDGDLDLWSEIDTDLAADNKMRPRYEDYLRRYLEGDTDFSKLNADTAAAPEKTQQPAPKPKEQIISELAPRISKPGITPGRATIEAQRLYADAERLFGPNADTVLETFEAGQEPRKFLDGFQNAYIAGKLGNKVALESSGAATYLTEEQRRLAYTLGSLAGNVPSWEMLDIVHNNSTMESDDLWIGKSLGAKAKNYKVLDLVTGEEFYFVEGTRLQDVEVFAGKGSSTVYRKAAEYADEYGGNVADWQHAKGKALLDTRDGERLAEVHWSQCPGVGKIDFFVKKWLD